MAIRRRHRKHDIDDLRRGSSGTVPGWEEEVAGSHGIEAHGSDDDTPLPARRPAPDESERADEAGETGEPDDQPV
jgi:hypothetical protein